MLAFSAANSVDDDATGTAAYLLIPFDPAVLDLTVAWDFDARRHSEGC